jgi:hypothetical protein
MPKEIAAIAMGDGISLEIVGTDAVITVPLGNPQRPSSSGKTFLVASGYTNVNGIRVQVNATVKNPAYVKPAAS